MVVGKFCAFIMYLLYVVSVFVLCFISSDISMLMPLDRPLARVVCPCSRDLPPSQLSKFAYTGTLYCTVEYSTARVHSLVLKS